MKSEDSLLKAKRERRKSIFFLKSNLGVYIILLRRQKKIKSILNPLTHPYCAGPFPPALTPCFLLAFATILPCPALATLNFVLCCSAPLVFLFFHLLNKKARQYYFILSCLPIIFLYYPKSTLISSKNSSIDSKSKPLSANTCNASTISFISI